jgi:hypothetical protein
MADDIYTPDERRLLQAWLDSKSLSVEDEALLAELGYDHDPCSAYTRLDAWVGAFAVRDIQERLPNCGIGRADGSFVLTRSIKKSRSRKVAGLSRFLFRINWADSAPGLSWPAEGGAGKIGCLLTPPRWPRPPRGASGDSGGRRVGAPSARGPGAPLNEQSMDHLMAASPRCAEHLLVVHADAERRGVAGWRGGGQAVGGNRADGQVRPGRMFDLAASAMCSVGVAPMPVAASPSTPARSKRGRGTRTRVGRDDTTCRQCTG